ncbi:RIP metalloprotease RseP [Pantanalinema rosaneae CENA516]|uniref:RIP metalloprotease RseP n=1 Tax=Pantanalinema rosaneae TaxID=1620701 RepID=UPI003D6F29C8
MSVLAAIAVLAILIVVHELGHFFAARAQGIYANRFSIGFGPILWSYKGSETEYAIRAFPLGGYVGFPDDDPDSQIPPNDPNLLKNRPILDRAIVISAGVIANLIFAYLVLVVQLGTVGTLEAGQPGVLIPQVVTEVTAVSPSATQVGLQAGDRLYINSSLDYQFNPQTNAMQLAVKPSADQPVKLFVERQVPDADQPKLVELALPATTRNVDLSIKPAAAIQTGIQPGDVILAVNGQEFGRSLREEGVLRKLIETSPNTPIQMEIRRGEQVLPLTITPRDDNGQGRIGAGLAPNGGLVRQRVSGFAVFGQAADEFQKIVNDTLEGFAQLIRKFSQTSSQVAGPVAIVAAGAKIAQSDAANLFYFAALISVNLAVINILPLPALDGGHLAFLLIEGLRGKPLPSKLQDGVMQTGLMLLLGLGIFLILRDTANLIQQ